MTHHCRGGQARWIGIAARADFALRLLTQELHVHIDGTTIRYDYFGAFFEGGGEGDAEAVSSLEMRRTLLDASRYVFSGTDKRVKVSEGACRQLLG